MVDDVLSIQKCSSKAVEINALINAFVEMKKLNLSRNKCHRIHISKQTKEKSNCHDLKVHEYSMETSTKEKYLGDFITNSGTPKANIEERRTKGYAIVAEIMAILNQIPLGRHKLEIGLQLRQAMLF